MTPDNLTVIVLHFQVHRVTNDPRRYSILLITQPVPQPLSARHSAIIYLREHSRVVRVHAQTRRAASNEMFIDSREC